MDFEFNLRSRIESILENHARNQAEVRSVSPSAFESTDGFDEERELYERVIASYRSALGEMNALLEEHVSFLSGFYHVVECIKDQRDFRVICSRIVDCVLDRFGAEYCGLIFPADESAGQERLCLEGIVEERKFLRIHSRGQMLGSETLERELLGIALETGEAVVFEDLYKEQRFRSIDFPAVMRSVAVLPVAQETGIEGFLLVSHSLPCFFAARHLRVFKILASLIAHIRTLTGEDVQSSGLSSGPPTPAANPPDTLSLVLLDFETPGPLGQPIALHREGVESVRKVFLSLLSPRDSLLFHEEGLLVLLPGTNERMLPNRVAGFRSEFLRWKATQPEKLQGIRMNAGFAVCEGHGDLLRAIELASHVMHPEREDLDGRAAS